MSDETPVTAALSMDRGNPLGNSEDVFLRRALHVKVGNKPGESIPVYEATPGTPFFAEADQVITPGVEQELISCVVPAAISRELMRLSVICRQEGSFDVLAGAVKIGSGRTGAAIPNVSFVWTPGRPISAGITIKVKFTARTGAPVTSNVEAYLQATDVAI